MNLPTHPQNWLWCRSPIASNPYCLFCALTLNSGIGIETRNAPDALPAAEPFVVHRLDSAVRSDFQTDVRNGLTGSRKSLPCHYIYDARGSDLFEQICALDAYYPPRAEAEIIGTCADQITRNVGGEMDLVELGSGSSTKTAPLIESALRAQRTLRYIPIDVSSSALRQSAERLLATHGNLEVHGLCGTYEDALGALPDAAERHRLLLWLGSSIGNFNRSEAVRFLATLPLRPGDRALIGFDLRKASDVLELAYDDPQGVTARFIGNVLVRINRELDGHFDHERFEYRAKYDADEGVVSMSLVSKFAQRVPIGALDLEIDFAAGEAIHVENSYKYSPEEIDGLASQAGLHIEGRWLDGQARFTDVLFARA